MKTTLGAAVAVLLLPGIAFGQAEKEIADPATTSPTPPTTWLPNTLFKLGTGLNRQSGYGGYSGLRLPLTLGAEYQLRPSLSLYANLAPVMALRRKYTYLPDNYRRLTLVAFSADIGARYYYNQAKREQRGRAHGPFVGNYLALEAGSDYYTYRRQNALDTRRYYQYDYSHVGVRWGMQRRIGQWGLFDGNAGLSLTNAYGRTYDKRALSVLLDVSASIGLAH